MHPRITKHAALALGVLLFGFADAAYEGSYFVLSAQGDPIVSEMLDPVMAPGQTPSNHVHEVYGGDKFQATWDYQTAQSSSCNNMGPKVDHSNYWFPALYFHGADNTFTKVPPHLEIYYHYDTQDNGPRTMFPNGFKMITGNPFLRHDDSATNAATSSIKWFCHGPDKVSIGSFPDAVTACPGADGFSGEIWFPFCWDGVTDFDPTKPSEHVVFGGDGTHPQGGKCPTSHPKALPQLFMEFHHDISAFASKAQAAQPWVLAPGDPTGYAMHADFVNGWEDGPGSLKDAIAVDPSDPTKTKCFVGESGPGAAACFTLLSNDEMNQCKVKATVDGDVVGPLTALPGCNPIQAGPEDATIQTNCAGYTPPKTGGGATTAGTNNTDSTDDTSSAALSSSVAPSTPSKTESPKESNPQMPTGSNPQGGPPSTGGSSSRGSGKGSPAPISLSNGETWTYQGCYSDLVPDRTIRTLGTWGSGKTSTDCAKHCLAAGFKISGTEYGSQCFCGNSMTQTKRLDDSKCDMPCDGSSETCGGSSAMSVYAQEGTNLGIKRRSHVMRHVTARQRKESSWNTEGWWSLDGG